MGFEYKTEFINHTYNPWILYIMIIIPSALIVLSIFLFVTACKKPYKEKIKLKKVGGPKKQESKKSIEIDSQKFNNSGVAGKALFFERTSSSNSIN